MLKDFADFLNGEIKNRTSAGSNGLKLMTFLIERLFPWRSDYTLKLLSPLACQLTQRMSEKVRTGFDESENNEVGG